MKIDQETGEILPENTMPLTDKAPAIIIDLSDVAKYHKDPIKLVEKINAQAGYLVFNVKTKKGRDDCRSHAAQIIKCIATACNESKRLANEAKNIVNQDVSFRNLFNAGVREIAEYHRKPLTEWEEEQERIAENERIFAEKMEAMRIYQLDWDDAIAYDELFTLRKEKAARDAEAEALRQLQEQEEYENQLQAQAIIKERERHAQEVEQLKRNQEEQREKIQQEEEAKATKKSEAEQAEKLEDERKKVRDEENARIYEENKERIAGLIDPAQVLEFEQRWAQDNIKNYPCIDGLIDVTISRIEYKTLKDNDAKLQEIFELWAQYERMLEYAQRAESTYDMRNEQIEAGKIQKLAIDLIKSVGK